MKESSTRNLTIPFLQRSSTRFFLAGAVALIMIFIIIVLTIYFFRSSLIDLRKQELQRLVMIGRRTVDPYVQEYLEGDLDRESAMDAIIDTVRRMTYEDPTMENYLFMSSYSGEMLVQPFEPEKEGSDQWDLEDSRGKYIIRELVRAARSGSGYVSYYYPPPDSEIPQMKISYVIGIQPLECYIGTGMYIGDIEAVIRSALVPMSITIAVTLLIYMGVFLFLTRPFLAVYRYLIHKFAAVGAEPDRRHLVMDLHRFRNAEARYLVTNFKAMITKIAENRREILNERSKLKLLLENLPAYAFLKDTEFRYVTANKMFCDWVDHSLEELIGKTDYEVFPAERADVLRNEDEQVLSTLTLFQISEESDGASGQPLFVDKRKLPILDNDGNPVGIIGLAFDISELKAKELRLETSLREKEMLLKEVHHRVKNNLQIISSLLNLQVMTLEDETYRTLLQGSSNRISSMATIHEMLYQSLESDTVEVKSYVEEVTRYLRDVYGVGSHTVRLIEEITIDVLDLDVSIPLGLIITELVSNSLKYAFPGNRKGTISVAMGRRKGSIELVVRDDGIGLPEHVLSGSVDSLGLLLVNSLTEQLRGTLHLENRDGAYFSIVFPQ